MNKDNSDNVTQLTINIKTQTKSAIDMHIVNFYFDSIKPRCLEKENSTVTRTNVRYIFNYQNS
jgi:hypothetical protein